MKHDLLSRKIQNVFPLLCFIFLLLFPAYLSSSVLQIDTSGSENVAVGDTIPEATFTGGEIHLTGDTTIPKNISDASSSAQIRVEKPDSSSIWKVGREETIEWTSVGLGFFSELFIWLYRGDGELVRRIYRFSGWGPATWTVPPYIEPGDDYYMVIFRAENPDVRGRTEGTFTIEEGTGPYITMLSPSGGEKWIVGEEAEIRWTSRNVQGEVEIRLYREGAILIDYISRGTTDDGTYTWTVPEDIEPNTDYYVGVRSIENRSVWDTNEHRFQIGYSNSDLSGIIDTRGEAWDVEISGNYAYIADHDGGITVADISNPSNPFEVSSVETPGRALTIEVVSNFAYVADRRGGLRVFNVSDPAKPTEVGFFDTEDDAWGVTVSGNYAYVAVDTDGLQILDISDPANPTEVSRFDTPGRAVNVRVRGNYAYVADYSGGLRILNISDPANPVEVSSLSAQDEIWDIDFKGIYAYVADHGIRVIDISDPANPTEVGNFKTSDSAWDVTVSGNYAYIAADNAGVRTINVSDPASPFETGYFKTPDPAYGVSSDGDFVYIAAKESGVYIIRNQSDEDVKPPAAPNSLSASLENSQVTLTWDANSETDLAEYRLYRFALPQKETEFISTISAGTETYTDSDLHNDRTYSYWVTAVDLNGNESGFSNEVQISVETLQEPPVTISLTDPENGPQLETIFVPENGIGYTYYSIIGEEEPFYYDKNFTIDLLNNAQSTSVEATARFLDENLIQIEIPYDLVEQSNSTEFQISEMFTAGEVEFQLDGQEVMFTATPTEQSWTRTWSIFAGGSAGISGSIGSIGTGVSISAAKASISGVGGVGLDLQIDEKDDLYITRRMEAGIATSFEAPSVNLVFDNLDVDIGIETEVLRKLMLGQTYSFSNIDIDEDQKKIAKTGYTLETISLSGVSFSPTVGLIVSASVNTINSLGNIDPFFHPARISSFGGIGLEGSVSGGVGFSAGPINITAFDASSGFVLNTYLRDYINKSPQESAKIEDLTKDWISPQNLSHSVEVGFMNEYDLDVLSWGINFGDNIGISGGSMFAGESSSEITYSHNFNQNDELVFIDFTLKNGGDIGLYESHRAAYRSTNVQIPAEYSDDLIDFESKMASGLNPSGSLLFGNSMAKDFQDSFNHLVGSLEINKPLRVSNSQFQGRGNELSFGITVDGALGAGIGLSVGFDLSLYDEIEYQSDYYEIYNGGDNFVLSSSRFDHSMEEAQLKEVFAELFSGALPLLENAIRNLSGRVAEKVEEGREYVIDLLSRSSDVVAGKIKGAFGTDGELFGITYNPRSNRVVQKAFDAPEVRSMYSSPNVLYSPVGKAVQTEHGELLEAGSEVIIISKVTNLAFIPEGESEPVDELDSSVTLEMEIKESDLVENEFNLSDIDRVKIYRYDLETNSWVRLDGELDEKTIAIDIQKMGSYGLGIEINRTNDETPPEIYESGFLKKSENNGVQEIFAKVRDDRYGSGVDFSATFMILNGDTLNHILQPSQNRIFYQLNDDSPLTGTTEEVTIIATDMAGNQSTESFSLVVTSSEVDNENPDRFELMENYPNPFNPQTVIPFNVPKAVDVKIRIYDVLGRYVATLLDERVQAGHHEVVWNSGISTGRELSTGVYFYQIVAGEFNQVKKMMYLK